jgi:RNA 3'-terminal phosphate cyclase
MAPPFDFLRQTLLPLLTAWGRKCGRSWNVTVFFPAGGGRFS